MEEPINQPAPPAPEPKSKAPMAVGTIVAILIVAGIAWFATRGGAPTSADGVNTNSGNTAVVQNVNYKDGTYTATGHYRSPAGPETIEVTLSVKDNVITDANVTSDATMPMSQRFQGMFIQNFKPMVVGVNLNQLNLTKVSGSSLTPMGFNDAVSQIKTQASAA